MQENLKKNDELEVTIDRFGANGEGIAIHNGKVIFVPFALPTEKVKIHIINDKNSFLVAKLLSVIKVSKNRCDAKCPYFTKCGGCDLQHLKYGEQLQLKEDIVRTAISKYAKLDVKVENVIGSDKVFRYRNKFAFPVQANGSEIRIGMYRKNSHDVIKIDDCLLQSERTKLILKLFKEYMIENKITAYDEKTKRGTIKHIVVRETESSFILTVVVTDERFDKLTPLIWKLKEHFTNFGIVKNINKLHNNVIFGDKDISVYGVNDLSFSEFGIDYYVNNRSFLQVNDYIKQLMYEKIIEIVGNSDKVIDAYSGAGLLSSILARNCKEVIGVEIVKEATDNADKLKNLNSLHNLRNINGDCSKVVPELMKKEKGDFTVVLDPPRKGVSAEVISAMLEAKPSKIIYISCNPATLARDLNGLKEQYNVTLVQPYDMFPQTANVETLVVLEKKPEEKGFFDALNDLF